MAIKKDNLYQHPEIILERMVKKSGLSQTRFAERVLGISGVNLSKVKKTGKIPDRWFDVMEEKYGVTKEELTRPPSGASVGMTTKAADGTVTTTTLVQPYGMATDDEEREHCLRELNSLFQIIIKWQEDENGLDSLTSMNFIREFHERFPELGQWLKKQKGKGDQTPSQEIISDGTDG